MLIHSGTANRYWAYIKEIIRETPDLKKIPEYYRDETGRVTTMRDISTVGHYIDGKKEIKDINMEFRANYQSGIEAPEREECGWAR